MRRPFKLDWLVVILTTLFMTTISRDISAHASAVTQNLEPSFALTISAAKGLMKAGSIVQIDVVVKNISPHDILLETNYTRPYVETTDHVNIVDENGAKASETQFGRAALGHSPGSGVTGKDVFMRLRISKSFTYQLKISELYDLSRPGKYTIQVERLDEESEAFVKSNTITVTVTP